MTALRWRRSLWLIFAASVNAIGATVSAFAVEDAGQPLSQDLVVEALVGRTVDGIYTSGRPWSETMSADGSTTLEQDGRTIAGRWRFDAAGRLCFNYPGEPADEDGCFFYFRLGPNCLEHFTETEGELVSNGRLWQRSAPSTCDERPLS